MISMCGNCSAKVVSVMDGHRPQIRCEGRWRAPYINARYGAAGSGGSPKCQPRCCDQPSDFARAQATTNVAPVGSVGGSRMRVSPSRVIFLS